MAYNKVVYDQKVLIDLTSDTVTEDKLLNGVTAHDKSGKIITGTFLQGYPPILDVEMTMEDSSGDPILDSDSENLVGLCIYERK